MKLYYTGAAKFETEQPFPYKSLGGYVSSSEIPNDVSGNLFDDITSYTIWYAKGIEYRVIAIYNDGASTLTGLKVWAAWNSSEDSNDNQIDTQLAAIGIGYQNPTADACGDITTVELPTMYSKPHGVNLSEGHVDQASALVLPNLEKEMYMTIILSRRILPIAKTPLSTETLQEISAGTVIQAPQENFNLIFSWT